MGDIEVNFVFGDEVLRLRSPVVPTEGSVVQIRSRDYTVESVYWTVDYPDEPLNHRALRATVDLVEAERLEEEEGEGG